MNLQTYLCRCLYIFLANYQELIRRHFLLYHLPKTGGRFIYQLHKQNLEGKTVSIFGGAEGFTRQITDRDIKVVYDRNVERH